MPTTIAEAIKDAERELLALCNEMSELCASIAARFPDTYEKIAKYQEALHALTALQGATSLIEQVDLDEEQKDMHVMVTVGRQTRPKRAMSQRVRLGNAIVRLTAAADGLGRQCSNYVDWAEALLREAAETVDGISFPKTYG